MPLNKAQSEQLSKPSFIQGLISKGLTVDQLLPVLGMTGVDGYAVEFPVFDLANMGTAGFIAAGAAPAQDSATPDSPNEKFYLYRMAGEFVEYSYYASAFSANNDQTKLQIEAKQTVMLEKLGNKVITGDNATHSEEIDGLVELLPSGNVVGANDDAADGGALGLGDIDRMISNISINHGQPQYLVGNKTVLEQFMGLMRTAGWQPDYRMVPQLGIEVPCYRRIPFLRCDHIPSTYTKGSGTNLTYLFGLVTGWKRGLTLIVPEGRQEDPFEVHQFRKDGTDDQVTRVTMSVGLICFNGGGLAAVNGITTT